MTEQVGIAVLMGLGAAAEFAGIWLIGREIRRTRQAAEDFATHLEVTRMKYGFTKLAWWRDSVETVLHEILDEAGRARRIVSFVLLLIGVVLTLAANLWALLRT
jgi:Flp pilus assembly protein TadB